MCKYSILIPAYKREYLDCALKSILAQKQTDFEVIIIDDASPEKLFDIVKSYLSDGRIKYYRNDNNIGSENVVDNWNKCLSLSSGEYVICMGDDDELLPDCLSEYDLLIEKYPKLGLYHALTEIIDGNGNVIDMQESRPEFESSLSLIWHRFNGRRQYIGDFCFKASLLKENGGFFPLPLAWGSDDISAYIASKGDGKTFSDGVANMQVPGFRYRCSDCTISSTASSRLKIKAGILYQSWFKDEFKKLDCDSVYLPILRSMTPENYFSLGSLVCQDMKKRKLSVFYWLNNRRMIGLSSRIVLKQFIKSFIK